MQVGRIAWRRVHINQCLFQNEHVEQHARNELREKLLSIQSGLEHVREGARG